MKCFLEEPSLDAGEFYNAYLNRESTDWDKLYQNYDAATDWTAAAFYKDLFKKYPDAKVILTLRPVDSWYESVKNTILKSAVENPKPLPGDSYYILRKLVDAVCMDGWIREPEKFAEEAKVKKMYTDHIEEVKRVIPPEQLCILELGDGWEKICKFLGKEVPDVQYPKVNSTLEFEKYFIKGNRPDNMYG